MTSSATSYERSDIDRSQSITIYDPSQVGEEWLRSLRLEGNGRHTIGVWTIPLAWQRSITAR